MRKKIVGITYDLKTDYKPGPNEPADVVAEFDSPQTIDSISEAFESAGHSVQRIGNVWKLLNNIDNLGVDIIFNICEGRGGRNRESQVPMILEMYNIPFVGADALSQAITLDKVIAKQLFISQNIPTPNFLVVDPGEKISQNIKLKFPLIVKARHEGSSKGLSEKSKVNNLSELRRQIKHINDVYKQGALIEEFIVGREFTVTVLGNKKPEAMPVVQSGINGQFGVVDQFYTQERVVGANNRQYACPASIPSKLAKRMQDIAVNVYKCVGCRDFGRVDFRVDKKNNPLVLEINPLPFLGKEDVFNLFPNVIGSSYNKILNKILNFALERYGMK